MTRKEKIDFLKENFNGIGPAKAEKIADLFHDVDNLVTLAYNKEAYEQLKENLGIAVANKVMDQLAEIKRQDESVQLMVKCGIPYFSAVNIAKQEMQFEAFKKDPYTVGSSCGLAFAHCDRFAHILFRRGTSPDMSRARMQWLIDDMLFELENSGHTFAYMHQLVKKINGYQKKKRYSPTTYSPETLALYLMNNDQVEIEKSKRLDRWKIYRKITADLENDIAYHIRRLAKNNQTAEAKEFVSPGLTYDEVQLSAIKSAAFSGLKVITGPPGSGKTAVINGIISYKKQLNPDAKIILCAPTGRAAKHMTEITGDESSTIHRLLGIGENQFIKKEKLFCDMVICDEASMLNLDVTYELLSRIKTGTVVYFVGDKDQLPAVGPGNVLHDIINSQVVPVYQLTKVYRQDGIILENAHEINKGSLPTQTSELYQTFTYSDATKLKDDVLTMFSKLYNPSEPFETQILVPSYKTDCGIDALNLAIQELNQNDYVYKSNVHKCAYKKYDKILMKKNHKDGLYQNGSVGIFLANYGDRFLIEFDGEEVEIPISSVEDMSLGYAISVHKSQGSEYKHVLLVLPKEPENMLKKNIFYTAVTRAKKDISIFEMEDSMRKCVDASQELFMQTGLKRKLFALMRK